MVTPVNVIPALMPGQSINDWGRLYKRATALFASDKQKIDSLPVYVCRNEGEVEIALLVVEEEQEDLDKALKRLSELIDGKPSRVLAAKKFFESSVTGELKTTFFILKKLGKEAELTNDVILLRFLGLLPSGVKFYDDNKAKMKAEMTDAELLELFALLQPRLDTAQNVIKKEPEMRIKQEKEDGFVFAADSEGSTENQRPLDHTEELDALKGELNSIKHYLLDQHEENWTEETVGEETEEVYYGAQKQRSMNSTRKCFICDRQGHFAAQCFKRKCMACGKLGHSTNECEENSGRYSKGYSGGHSGGHSRGQKQRQTQKDSGRRANL